MKFKVPFLIFTFFAIGCSSGLKFNEQTAPIIPEGNSEVRSITFEKMRIQILDESTFRFEYMDNRGRFLDKNTFFVPNRDQYRGIKNYATILDSSGMHIYFQNMEIRIAKNSTAFNGIKVFRNNVLIYDSDVVSLPQVNNGTLPDPDKTPDVFQVLDAPRIIIPEHGYNPLSVYDNPNFELSNGYEIQENSADLYLLIPNHNPRDLLKQYVNLTGRTEMVRLSTLGAWDSRYYEYTEQSAQEEIDNYNKFKLPLDNLVIDTDWRIATSGTGYDVNTDLFPNMPRFLNNVHKQNIEVCFNDHPEPVLDASGRRRNVFEKEEVKFRQENLTKILNMGLDYWWYDRNWGVHLESPVSKNKLSFETLGDYLFHDVTKQYFAENMNDGNGHYRRPIIMCNVDDINSGHYNTFRNTASHRYSLQWTGDISPAADSIGREIANVIRSGNSAIPYMSSDLSGHTGVASDFLYNRWIQYGALSPIFRIHCTRNLPIHCQPWFRDPKGTNGIVNHFRDYINMRYRLLPLFYSLSHENYMNGMPICRSLAFSSSNIPEDYISKEWTVGDNILFAPLNEDEYFALSFDKPDFTIQFFENKFEKQLTNQIKLTNDNKQFFYPDLLELSRRYIPDRSTYFSMTINNQITVPANEKLFLAATVDDGVRIKCKTPDQPDSAYKTYVDGWRDSDNVTYSATEPLTGGSSGTTYDVKVEYYQAGGGAALKLQKKMDLSKDKSKKNVYLPNGNWYDLTHGVSYQGNNEIKDILYGEKEAPIFVKEGSLIPLVGNADNTKTINWNEMVLDVYPGDNEYSDVIYEDDKVSTAYKDGIYRVTPYHFIGSKDGLKTEINIGSAIGDFADGYLTTNRKIRVRFHNLLNKNTVNVKINNQPRAITKVDKTSSFTMPFQFNNGEKNIGHSVVEFDLPASSIREPHNIVINLGD